MSEHVSEKAKPVPIPRSASRTAARLAAVQALYQMDMAGTDANLVVREFLEYRLTEGAESGGSEETDEHYFRDIVI